jgi:hypothetical protein
MHALVKEQKLPLSSRRDRLPVAVFDEEHFRVYPTGGRVTSVRNERPLTVLPEHWTLPQTRDMMANRGAVTKLSYGANAPVMLRR